MSAGLKFRRRRAERLRSVAGALCRRISSASPVESASGFALRFDFESFHQQWNATTIQRARRAPRFPGIYRERYHMSPSISVALLESLTFYRGCRHSALSNTISGRQV